MGVQDTTGIRPDDTKGRAKIRTDAALSKHPIPRVPYRVVRGEAVEVGQPELLQILAGFAQHVPLCRMGQEPYEVEQPHLSLRKPLGKGMEDHRGHGFSSGSVS